ncbi:hypothetical protein GGX14DRAFT_366508 [Mycena pura]|uniref:Uncharacterized protein n=1 Tax=Mycena pura TaxID=153505 RepID=A0AAD6VAE4_9AGAR|nr:hypothetical protein GGX14DRAFT_366508 [Mycena pura]
MTAPDPDPESKPGEPACRIAEITQYSCVPQKSAHGHPFVHCVPIPRLFRVCACASEPVVEVTRVLHIDVRTGCVEVPGPAGLELPKGNQWRDVVRYTDASAIEDQ